MKNSPKRFWYGIVIREDDRFVLTHGQHMYDTNYHLIDKVTENDYLIDHDDVANDLTEFEQFECLITFEQLLEIDLIDLIEFSWKSE